MKKLYTPPSLVCDHCLIGNDAVPILRAQQYPKNLYYYL